jgi:RHS repeat-associated protein
MSSVGNTIGYAGYVWDPALGGAASGQFLARHRWYSPNLGRWTSRDPIGYADGMNLYGYVGGMPLMLVDPMGLLSWGEFWRGETKLHSWVADKVVQPVFGTDKLATMSDTEAYVVGIGVPVAVGVTAGAAMYAGGCVAAANAGTGAWSAMGAANIAPHGLHFSVRSAGTWFVASPAKSMWFRMNGAPQVSIPFYARNASALPHAYKKSGGGNCLCEMAKVVWKAL